MDAIVFFQDANFTTLDQLRLINHWLRIGIELGRAHHQLRESGAQNNLPRTLSCLTRP